jgi:hypothetical protein
MFIIPLAWQNMLMMLRDYSRLIKETTQRYQLLKPAKGVL